MQLFSDRLKALREEKRLKQEELGKAVGCSRFMISYFENGREPSYDTLLSLCKYFDVSADYLLGHTGERKPAGDELSIAIHNLNAIAPSAAPSSALLADTFNALLSYYKDGTACGDTPTIALKAFTFSIRNFCHAAINRDPAAILAAANAAMLAGMDCPRAASEFLSTLHIPS